MIYSSIHNHTIYCDGKSTVEQLVLEAIKNGLQTVGISTHGPLPFKAKWAVDNDKIDKYIDEVNYTKDKYNDKIQVLLGMELDYFIDTEFNHVRNDIFDKLDYWIGSIHYLGRFENGTPWTIDGNVEKLREGVQYSYNGNTREAIRDYYINLGKMVKKYKPDVVGHLDLIKKLNKENILFNEIEIWYQEAVYECLENIKQTNSVIEINTGGISRGYLKSQYPSNWILNKIKELNIPITINSDAHEHKNIIYGFNNMIELVSKIGFTEYVYLSLNGWKKVRL